MVTNILRTALVICLIGEHSYAMEEERSRRYETKPLLTPAVTGSMTEVPLEDAASKSFRTLVEDLALKFAEFESFSKAEKKSLLAAAEYCCSTMSMSSAGMYPRITVSEATEKKVQDIMKIYAQHRPARCIVN